MTAKKVFAKVPKIKIAIFSNKINLIFLLIFFKFELWSKFIYFSGGNYKNIIIYKQAVCCLFFDLSNDVIKLVKAFIKNRYFSRFFILGL